MDQTTHADLPLEDIQLPEAPVAAAAPAGRLARVTARLRREAQVAMVDPSRTADGDFDLLRELSAPSTDHVAAFNGLISAMRMATTAISILLVSQHMGTGDKMLMGWTAVVLSYAMFRTFKPVRVADDLPSLLRVVGELALHVAAIVMTGGWGSPLIFTLLTAVTVAGLARGVAFSIRIAVVTVLAVSVPVMQATTDKRTALLQCATWGGVIVLVAIIAGFSRRVSGEADRERELAVSRLGQLADANDLLYSLHQVTQTLPASLDMADVLDSTLNRMKTLVAFDSAAVLLFDEADAHWDIVRHQGLHVGKRLGPTDLSPGLRAALAENGVVHMPDLSVHGGGLSSKSGSGLYSVLAARGSVIGLIAIEHHDFGHFTSRDEEVVRGFVEPASLALDNARWFARLRTVGADEERTRIARDLHDNIGQSLAYLGFELDRMVNMESEGQQITSELHQLRDDVRGVTREVRDTLYDLRTDVTEDMGLGVVLEQFAARLTERTGLVIQVEADKGARLPMLQEREMWRVAQEALANVERHARATAVRVVWRCDGTRALIDVTDNGVGFEQGRAGRLDSYGVMGMRERASSVGAALEILSAPGRGTRVRCSINPDAIRPERADQSTAARR